jgi:CheY-like chemotaxis protein
MKKKIIIAQSIQQAVTNAESLFSRGSVGVLTAATSEDLLQLHRTHKADLIIAQSALPVMGGLALCRTIRKDPGLRDVSLIMACAGDDPAVSEYRAAGCNEVLLIPVDPVRLFSTVSRMLMVQNRMAVRIPLRITVEGSAGKETFIGISHDLSVSGMLLDSARMLQPGDRLHCSFSIGTRVVSVDCEVVRTQRTETGRFQFGAKFVNLDAKTFVLLEHFVKSTTAPRQGHHHA